MTPEITKMSQDVTMNSSLNTANDSQHLSFSIKKKLIILFLIAGLIPLLLFGLFSMNKFESELLKINKDRLISLREEKKMQIENYFQQIGDQVLTFSESTMIIDAMGKFSVAFNQVEDQMQSKYGEQQIAGLKKRYQYQQENTPGTSPEAVSRWFPKSKATQILQSLHISENKNPIGAKEKLDTAEDYSSYSQIHQQCSPSSKSGPF